VNLCAATVVGLERSLAHQTGLSIDFSPLRERNSTRHDRQQTLRKEDVPLTRRAVNPLTVREGIHKVKPAVPNR
jgi:hypothetical protein